LLEVGIGTADEGVCVLELAVEIFPFLHVLNLDVHGEAFGYGMKFMAKSFHQDAAVALDLFEAFIYFIKSPIVPVQSLLNPAKPLVKVLNKFLIHAASVVKLNGKPFSLACQ